MKLRFPAATVALVLLGGALAAPAAHADPSTTVVISKIMTRGPAPTGGNNEVIELKNKSTAPVAIGGWQVWGTNANGMSQSARVTITAGTVLAPGAIYRLTNSQGAQTGGDQTYSTGIADDGGAQLRSSAAAASVIDAVGSEALTGAGVAFREGTRENPGLVFPTANGENAFTRKGGGTQDTDDNDADFDGPVTQPTSCPKDANGFTKITDIQSLGSTASAACNNQQNIKIRGIVTGIDDLYGSNFDNVFRSDAGLWVQEAQRDPAATTSNAIFIAGVRRNAASPAAVIGSDITITGRIETKFGLVQLVPPGVGTTNQTAQEVNLTDVATVNSTGQRAPGGRHDRPHAGRGSGRQPHVLPLAAGHARAPARGRSRPAAGRPSSATCSWSRARPRSGCSARTTRRRRRRRGRTRRPRSASRPTAAPATPPIRACHGARRRRSTSTCSTSRATSWAR